MNVRQLFPALNAVISATIRGSAAQVITRSTTNSASALTNTPPTWPVTAVVNRTT